MKSGLCFWAVLATGLLVFPSNAETTKSWNVVREQALDAAKNGRFETAETLLRAAIALFPDEDNPVAVTLWNDIGGVHQSRGQATKAENDFRHALSINARLPEPINDEAAIALNNLATIAGAKNDTAQAESSLRQAYRMLEKAKQTEGRTAALVKSNLALTLQQEGRYIEAAPLYDQASTSVKALFGEKSLEYARILTNRTLFQFQTGAYRTAVENGRLARSIQRDLPYVSDAECALTLNHLGMSLSEVGLLEEARAALTEAIELERRFPNGRAQIVFSLNSLATVEQREGHMEQAKERELQLLEMRNGGVPVDNLTVAAALNMLGRIATAEHKFEKAREQYSKASGLLEQSTGPQRVQYAATLSNMGALEMAQRHFKKAEELYKKALAINQSQLGSNHPAVASDLSNIGAVLFYQKRPDDALELYRKAQVVVEGSLGPGSLAAAQLWHNMGVIYFSDRRDEVAASAYLKAVKALDESSGGKGTSLPGWLREYASALRRLHRWGEAETAETRALGIEVRSAVAAGRKNQSIAGTTLSGGKV